MATRNLADSTSLASEAAYGVAKLAPDGDVTTGLAVQADDARLLAADDLATHLADAVGAHAAEAITFTVDGDIVATNVQDAIEELDAEKAALAHTHTASNITDFTEASQDVIGAMVTAAGGSYNDGAGTIAFPSGTVAADIHGASGKTTPVDADELALADSAASFALKKLTWANLKATVKAYFDTLYAALVHTHDAVDIDYDNSTSLLAATDVQAAIDEVVDALATGTAPTGAAGGVLGGTYPNPSFAADMVTQAELDAHTGDTSDAHDASAISFAPASGIAATDVQAAIVEDAGDLADHLADATAAHAASAIAFTPDGNIAATTVQAAIVEVRDEALSGSFQPLDADLTTIAGLTATTDNFLVSVASAWASRTPAQVRSTLALVIGTNVQAWDTDLDTLAGLAKTRGNLIRGGAAAWEALALGTTGYRLISDGTDVVYAADYATFAALVTDGTGAALTTGLKAFVYEVPFACTIVSVRLFSVLSGSVVVDIWKTSYANFDGGSTHPVSGDKITASAPPTITTAKKSEDTTLTAWTLTLAAGDLLMFNVTSATTIQDVSLSLRVRKTA